MKETRQKALEWWRALGRKEKVDVVKKHFGDVDFHLVSTSSNRIERMFKLES